MKRAMDRDEDNKNEVIALAVDGMEPTLLDRWIREGELPNLAVVRESGASGTAECSSLSSATQWTTHFTGVGPETHGIDGFLTTDEKRSAGDRAPDAGKLINLSNIDLKTYPELLDESDISVGLINPLPLWPPLELERGFCISGMLTPPSANQWVHPPELESEIKKIGYQIDVKYGDRPYGFVDNNLFAEVSLETLYEDMFDVLDARIAYTKQAISDQNPEYLYVLLKSIDIIQHCFWAHMESDDATYGNAILESYKRVDELVGWVRKENDGHLLLFSDHGFKRRRSDPLPGLHALASIISDFVPVPKSIRERYLALTTSAVGPEDNANTAVDSTTGVHANPAVWLLDGPAIGSQSDRTIAFEDIPPTILALLDHPIPEAYVGEPIDALTKDVARESLSLSIRRNVAVAESEVISERLHNLGYAEMVEDN
jgi:predicted AlkP superfamily phosphohydrolase/phosphomutase